MSAAIALAFGVLLGFALARVPAGELPRPSQWRSRFKAWRRSREYAHNRARCARGDHVDLGEPDENDVRYCHACETLVHPNGQEFAV